MPKQISLFLDGTFNTDKPSSGNGTTNVQKLYAATHGAKKYIKGVAADSGDLLEAFLGLGTADKIRQAYRFLTQRYEPGDSIYIFGFSRGAFAARSLAGFAFRVGLLLNGNDTPANLDGAWRAYTKPSGDGLRDLRKHLYEISGHESPEERNILPVHFIGVWDTVAALGGPFKDRPLVARFAQFHRHELPRNVTHGRHAIAIHEGRQTFEPLLFSRRTAPNFQTLEQRWFTGAHADVGGGYSDLAAGLARPALRWMANEAVAVGFDCDNSLVGQAYSASNPVIHQEYPLLTHRIRPALSQADQLSVETRQSFSIDNTVSSFLVSLPTSYPSWARQRLLQTDLIIRQRLARSPQWI